MEAVCEEATAGHGKGIGSGSSGVGKVMRKGVAGVEGDAVTAAAGYFDGAAGVVALGGVFHALDDAPAGVRAVIGDLRAVVRDAGSGGRGLRGGV